MNSSDTTVFVIVAFALAIVVLLSRNSIPQKFKRGLALFSLIMVIAAFVLIIYSFSP
ncbi:hypothetical protein [Paenibacillus pinistramenti]|uniref:hypothetical protein n=1 Tax=Paenibacillus pinistramenti TaxID=1768003 RepID=UPI0019392E21|nr:hypothetical protein [Paenibacillus pinistramenti]